MEEKTKQIIDKIDKTKEVERLKELKEKLNKNDEYLNLMESVTNENILEVRKKLFEIDELKEYLELQNYLRVLSIKINNIILSVL